MKRKMISVALCTAMVASMMAGTAVTASAEEKNLANLLIPVWMEQTRSS